VTNPVGNACYAMVASRRPPGHQTQRTRPKGRVRFSSALWELLARAPSRSTLLHNVAHCRAVARGDKGAQRPLLRARCARRVSRWWAYDPVTSGALRAGGDRFAPLRSPAPGRT
jgi:hypothetical protein